VLYTFTGGGDGGVPYAGVVSDSDGDLYGTTLFGGTGYGVVYKLDVTAHESVLYTFTGGFDGGTPYSGVVFDSGGNLYGTTLDGGFDLAGVVYKLGTDGQETVLNSFYTNPLGSQPTGVVLDPEGNLYGTTVNGGSSTGCDGFGCGVVYELSTTGETILHTFTGEADGGDPQSGVIRDSNGTLFGTTDSGGKTGCLGLQGCGVVYMLALTGQYTNLYTFTGAADGGNPQAGLVRDSAGNLYGTTYVGGKQGLGTVFKVTPPPNACGVLDITSQTTVSPGASTYIPPSLYEYSQDIKVRYNGAGSVTKAYLVLHGEPTINVALEGKQIETHCFSSAGDYLIPLGALQAGKTVGIPLVWVTNDVPSTGIAYTTRVLNGIPEK